MVSDMFEVNLHDLERLGALPVNELSLFFTIAAESWAPAETAAVAAQNMADRAGWNTEFFILG
jgi:hypothetical protein